MPMDEEAAEENREIAVGIENREIAVGVENREIAVGVENREIAVEENREIGKDTLILLSSRGEGVIGVCDFRFYDIFEYP